MRHLQITVALLSVSVLLITGFAWKQFDSFSSRLATAAGLSLGNGEDGAIDILLVGIDSRTDAHGDELSDEELEQLRAGDVDGTNTDTIILIRIPEDGGSAAAFSIPRDSYVEIPDDVPGKDWPSNRKVKINSVFGSTRHQELVRLVEREGMSHEEAEPRATAAGREALVSTVAELTDITVDHYAEIGLLGFILLTDAVGGVEVCLNNAVNEPKSGANFPAGRQTLDGADALSFVRQREGLPGMDIGRIHRQQVFMASLAQRVLSTQVLTNPTALNRLSQAIQRSVVLDSEWDILGFAKQFQGLAVGDVQFETIPVVSMNSWSTDGMQSVVEIDPDQVRERIAEVLATEPEPEEEAVPDFGFDASEVTVSVANASFIEGLATRVSDELNRVGFSEGEVGNWLGRPTPQSKVITADASSEAAQAIAEHLGGLAIEQDTSLEKNQIQVVLTTRYDGPGAEPPPDSVEAAEQFVAGEGDAPPPPMTADNPGPPCID
ncbi:LCP family protein [Hoyosella subflava]|uniref:LytR family transcriptional regulator n=1 Tax=Hoyosella subflava (strain DSM 45089 / JCM 17490 / NBRC 109087 / DQS3-9A1) TaxID=443218 RepID=F6EFZ1_HOYSD|nr:LCP family protein [Hoyosella subflava]AEF42255.1 LytR family transcriptional regulator [Hoyosella subflava DQS3-9A1]